MLLLVLESGSFQVYPENQVVLHVSPGLLWNLPFTRYLQALVIVFVAEWSPVLEKVASLLPHWGESCGSGTTVVVVGAAVVVVLASGAMHVVVPLTTVGPGCIESSLHVQ